MAQENSGLLIAALVAIVAVVGLVILFKGGAEGAAVCAPGYGATVTLDTSSMICVPLEAAATRQVAFERPFGSKGQWKKFDYPKSP